MKSIAALARTDVFGQIKMLLVGSVLAASAASFGAVSAAVAASCARASTPATSTPMDHWTANIPVAALKGMELGSDGRAARASIPVASTTMGRRMLRIRGAGDLPGIPHVR